MNKQVQIYQTIDAVIASHGGEIYDRSFGAIYARFKDLEHAEDCANFLRENVGNLVGIPEDCGLYCETSGKPGKESTIKIIPHKKSAGKK